MFKFTIGQRVWHMVGSKVGNSEIWSRACIENAHDDWAHTDQQKSSWQPFGPSGIKYQTAHGTFEENELFATKEELLKSL